MELRPGYKHSGVGPIPLGWEERRLDEVAVIGSGGTPSRDNPSYWNGAIPWITTSQIDFNEISEAGEYITEAGLNNSAAKLLRAGTLLMALYGQGKTRGKVGVLTFKAATNQACASIAVGAGVSAEFVRYFLTNRYDAIRSASNGGSQDNLSGQIVKSLPLVLPPLPEQKAIAAALIDADALLGALDRLIAKKHDLKQAATQQLLTGQTRLPGFRGRQTTRDTDVGRLPDDWLVVPVCDIASVKTGPFGSTLHEEDYVADGTPIITVEHLGERGIRHIGLPMVSEADRRRLSAYSLLAGDIVFSRVGSIDRNALVSQAEEGWLFSGRLLRVRPSDERVHTRYLSYHFHSEPFKQRVRSVAVGQTMASLNTQILKSILVVVPPVREQEAIGDVLFAMNAELTGLEQRRHKTRLLKQGMMQELLTGRTRLV